MQHRVGAKVADIDRVVVFVGFIFCLGGIVDCIDCNPVPRGTGEPAAGGASTEVRPHSG